MEYCGVSKFPFASVPTVLLVHEVALSAAAGPSDIPGVQPENKSLFGNSGMATLVE